MHRARDAFALEIVADEVERNARVDVVELGLHKSGDDRFGHSRERCSVSGFAGGFHGEGDAVEMLLQECLQQRVLVGEVLIERSDRDASAFGDAGRGQLRFAFLEQNLNSCLHDGCDARGRARLDGRLSWLEACSGGFAQMRTPNLKLSSSNM